MSEPNAMPPVYAGIDVCKEWLDVYVHPAGKSFRVANDSGGLRRLKRLLGELAVRRVVMEATSKYHRAAQRSLHEAGLAVAVVNPLCGRQSVAYRARPLRRLGRKGTGRHRQGSRPQRQGQ
ncbi:MAG: hypothetical protein EOR78_12490 [Mesorhizobium sp.]|nr:MAG: hypothetical protein EOR49_04210 [Mesorhizobium sp.]RWM46192.1 MAG: hypothetical protein EOR76_18495 [Mesorhizobium sp.]RWM56601.1 MAG: hypothetical protein EOR78_12490 [Mesorhizobium sp.]RWM61125.1 MAG: hypothetical protein EOR79_06390 [Mesorhizobium sp.]RWN05499.1 MAG: hypothetical protein EOR85_02195 [Mesorhizobium sp.]